MSGLKVGASSSADNFTALDFAFGRHPDGNVIVFESGHVKFNAYCSLSMRPPSLSTFEISISNNAVEYKIDGDVKYISSTTPPRALHFAIAWLRTGTVTNARYIKRI